MARVRPQHHAGLSLHRVSVEPHASALAARADGSLIALVGGRRAVLLDPFELPVRPRHELSLLRPAACAAWGRLTPDAAPDHAALFVGMDNGRVEGWLRKEDLAQKYDNAIVLEHPTAAGAAGLAAVPGRWPASGRVHAVALSPHIPGQMTTVENRRLHLWQIDDETIAASPVKALASSTISREPIFAMDWSPGQPNTVAIGDAGSAIHLVDARTIGQRDGAESVPVGPSARATEAHSGSALRGVQWLDGSHLASTGDDGVVKVWDVRKPDAPLTALLRAHVGPATNITAGQNMIASGGVDGRVRLWNWKVSEHEPISISVNKLWNVESLARCSPNPVGIGSTPAYTAGEDGPDFMSPHPHVSSRPGRQYLPEVAFRDSDARSQNGIPESIAGITLLSGLIIAVSADGKLARTTVL